MDQDYDDTFEKFPGDKNDEIDPAAAAKAAEWEMAMEDAPAFAGEWGYGETYENPDAPESSPSSDAASLTDYGLDTASRIYGLNTVLDAILETDETASDAENPIGSIYDRLAPSPEDRKFLFREIKKDGAKSSAAPENSSASDRLLVGMTADGQFYDKLQHQDRAERTSADAIIALRRLIDLLETSDKFADVREHAAENQMSVIDYLTSSNASPTLSYLLERISQTSAEDDLEDLAEELIQDLPETPDDTDSPESPRDFSGPDSLDDLSGSDSAENPHFPS